LRTEKVAALKGGLESQQNVFEKQSNDNSPSLRASYRVAHLFATHSAWDMSGKRNCFQYRKTVTFSNDITSWRHCQWLI